MFLQRFLKSKRSVTKLPNLNHLMGSYFHQDYDLIGGSDDEILRNFATTNWEADVEATVQELDELLTMPIAGLLQRFVDETGRWNMTIGEDDASARAWLANSRYVLAASLASAR